MITCVTYASRNLHPQGRSPFVNMNSSRFTKSIANVGPRALAVLVFCLPVTAQSQRATEKQWIAFNRAGAGNSDLQCFIPANVYTADGSLVITTKKESATCSSIDLASATHDYTSGFVSMRTFNFLYGTVEFRAKFGGGDSTGAWPAVWMLDASCQASDPTGTDDPCNGQEIDIAEILDGNFKQVNQQIHINSFAYNDGCTPTVSDTSQNFHIYRLDWSPGKLVFAIDGIPTCNISAKYVPYAPMYVKISMFVGKYGGPVKNDTFPWKTVIDYVKVTQGNAVVFSDDFDSADTVQAAPYILVTPATPRSPIRTAMHEVFMRWPIVAFIVCLTLGVVLAALKLQRAKHIHQNPESGR